MGLPRGPEREGQGEDPLQSGWLGEVLWDNLAGRRPPKSPPWSCPQEARDIGEGREMQKQPQDPAGATGAQDLGNPRPGFMKCLLEVEEEKATHWRVTKARALPSRKSPRTLAPVPVSSPVGNSAPTLPLTLPQTPASAPAMAPCWARPPAPGPLPAPMGAPASVRITVLPVPASDLGWRRTELLHHSGERSLNYPKAR